MVSSFPVTGSIDRARREAIRREVILPDEFYNRISEKNRRLSFSVAGLANLSQVQHVKDQLDRVLLEGLTFQEFKNRVRSGDINVNLPNYRLQNIFRTNVSFAINRGRLEKQLAHTSTHPIWEYETAGDEDVRDNHAAMNGTRLPANHDWWRNHYTPNGFNERCRVISRTTQQSLDSGGITPAPNVQPDPGFNYDKIAPNSEEQGVRRALRRESRRSASVFEFPAAVALVASFISSLISVIDDV